MAIVPQLSNSIVALCKGVPLDNTYKDTLTFTNATAQNQYFSGKVKQGMYWDNSTVIRGDGSYKISVNKDSIIECNYLMYRNQQYSNRWFYCFITGMEYINPNTTLITYEVDVMQTWLFDYDVQECFVQNEHVHDDTLFYNRVSEDYETGELIQTGFTQHFDYSDLQVGVIASIVWNTETEEWERPTGQGVNNLYCGMGIMRTNNVDTRNQQANIIISKYIDDGKEESILNIFMFPEFCRNVTNDYPTSEIKEIDANTSLLDGYSPKNNKMFNYPFNFFQITNNQGNIQIFKYEEFDNPNNIRFEIVGVLYPNPSLFCYPLNYRGIEKDYDSGLTIANFPNCAWTGDTFKAWLAQNKGSLALSGLTSIGTIVGGVVAKNPMAIGSGIIGVSSQVGQIYDRTQHPNTSRQSNSDSITTAMERISFDVHKMCCHQQYAKIIDKCMDMFGYKVNRVKKPNITGRQSYNYVKTIDAIVTGNVGASDILKIASNFDKGITFWHGDYVGDYSRSNEVV